VDPLTPLSAKVRAAPTAWSEVSCRSRFCSVVEILAYQRTENAQSGRGETVRTIQGSIRTHRNDRDHDTEHEDGQANDREADPANHHRQLHREHDATLPRTGFDGHRSIVEDVRSCGQASLNREM
jgi:hypothetical protein